MKYSDYIPKPLSFDCRHQRLIEAADELAKAVPKLRLAFEGSDELPYIRNLDLVIDALAAYEKVRDGT